MEVRPPHSLHPFLAHGADVWVEIGQHLVQGRFAEEGRVGGNSCCPSHPARDWDAGTGDRIFEPNHKPNAARDKPLVSHLLLQIKVSLGELQARAG